MIDESQIVKGLTWRDHPIVYDAKDTMPSYRDYANSLQPDQFIKRFWYDCDDEVRESMIEFIEMHPFDGCEKYVNEWNTYICNTYGQIPHW